MSPPLRLNHAKIYGKRAAFNREFWIVTIFCVTLVGLMGWILSSSN